MSDDTTIKLTYCKETNSVRLQRKTTQEPTVLDEMIMGWLERALFELELPISAEMPPTEKRSQSENRTAILDQITLDQIMCVDKKSDHGAVYPRVYITRDEAQALRDQLEANNLITDSCSYVNATGEVVGWGIDTKFG